MEVQRLREDRQKLHRLQEEVKTLKTTNKFLEDLNREGANSSLKEETLSLQKNNQELQASNTQLKEDITHLDVELAHLKYLGREIEELRNAEQKRKDDRETQLQHAINLKVDLMNASTLVDCILEGFVRHDDTSSSATDTGVEAKTDSKGKPLRSPPLDCPVPSRHSRSPSLPPSSLKAPRSACVTAVPRLDSWVHRHRHARSSRFAAPRPPHPCRAASRPR